MKGLWIVLLGAPGCGKGTLSEKLVSEGDFLIVSVGDLLRSRKNEKLPGENLTLAEMLSTGALLSDEIIVGVVRAELSSIKDLGNKNIIFDGFPRTKKQAEALDELAKEFSTCVDKVLIFNVKDDIITKRILGRYTCKNCKKIYNEFFSAPKVAGVCDVCGSVEFNRRQDDTEETLKKRLQEYDSKTKPLIDFYKDRQGVLFSVDAEQSASKIYEDVKEELMKGCELKS